MSRFEQLEAEWIESLKASDETETVRTFDFDRVDRDEVPGNDWEPPFEWHD